MPAYSLDLIKEKRYYNIGNKNNRKNRLQIAGKRCAAEKNNRKVTYDNSRQ